MLESGAIFHERYRVVRCIKSGGMGTVYEVTDSVTNGPRALKTMLPGIVTDPEFRARFSREAKVTGPIRSQHIVKVYDAGVDEPSGVPFLVMELLEGEDLGTILQNRGPLPIADCFTLFHQLSLALDRTHDADIVHRDLKPENLFLTTRDDGAPHLMVLDFGIAKVIAQSARAKTTRNVGTPLYMSPEQIRGDGRIDRRTDLYSVGHIVFALLTGHAYFEPEATEIYALMLWITEGAREPASERAALYGVKLPLAFDAWFARATAVDVHLRFDNAREMLDALAMVFGVAAPRGSLHSVPGSIKPETGATLHSEAPRQSSRSEQTASEMILVRGHAKKSWSRTVPLVLMTLVAIGVGLAWLSHLGGQVPLSSLPRASAAKVVQPVETSAGPSIATTAPPRPAIEVTPIAPSALPSTSASPSLALGHASTPSRSRRTVASPRPAGSGRSPTASSIAAEQDPTDYR